eukprot:CAMPEP_0182548324 /NCGR_PEP_ID=MMETSP1323-20130603/38670_1 /TAXON_ID=236787 /ORGANISM="Florenciella parvula, Strain RCC1693" /LENGTH=38 /DNA_ID= /DNA_START= /DNA_END= /DNA_ORIENTATION=
MHGRQPRAATPPDICEVAVESASTPMGSLAWSSGFDKA